MGKKHIENLEQPEVIEEVIVKPKTKAPSKVRVQPVIESNSSTSDSEELEKPVRKPINAKSRIRARDIS